MNFTSFRSMTIGLLTRQARAYLRADKPIPADLYAKLIGAGVDIPTLERKARNG